MDGKIKLMILDPGHFHAALVQKNMYDQVDHVVHVFAPHGPDALNYVKQIDDFNSRRVRPTHWKQQLYLGADFLERMISDKPGNVVIVAGKNVMKAQYILSAVQAGLHVLADKPMAIKPGDFRVVKKAFKIAEKNRLLLYDIMTERYEIATILQRELSGIKEVFGELKQGTPQEPAVVKESVHHFFKFVAGYPIRRPPWSLDADQQGEGIADVSTHLIDLVFWECFPETGIDYEKDIQVISAHRWDTQLSPDQFQRVTHLNEYPDYLRKDVKDSVLNVSANGEIVFRVKGIHSKISVIWDNEASEGAGDIHYSLMRGTRSNLIIRQGKDEGYKPTLYVDPAVELDRTEFAKSLKRANSSLKQRFPGIAINPVANVWQVVIPEKYRIGHEAHFAQVTEKYLEYLTQGALPDWEVPNMISKYYVTTRACEMVRSTANVSNPGP